MLKKPLWSSVLICYLAAVSACASQDPYAYEKKQVSGAILKADPLTRAVMNLPDPKHKGPVTGPLGLLDYPGGPAAYMADQEEELRSSLADTGVSVERHDDSLRLVMPDPITFAFDSYQLQAKFLPVLDEVVQILSRYEDTVLDLAGHADSIGTEPYNQTLSENRAQAVANYLVKSGISKARLRTVGFGETRPVVPNKTEALRAKNRRVELDISLPEN